jgi:hypothetical protein
MTLNEHTDHLVEHLQGGIECILIINDQILSAHED